MKAVFLDFASVGPKDLNTLSLTNVLPDIEIRDATAVEDVVGKIADADIVLTNKVKLDRNVLQYADRLKLIGLTATGTDNVDLDFARQQRIAVCNIRAYCTASVVEHVFGALLNLAHSLHRYQQTVRNGNWSEANEFCLLDYPVRELSAMTLGIVGYGELGRGVARMAEQFGMRVLIANSHAAGTADEKERVSLDAMLQQADVISLHCPLTSSTQNMFAAPQFAAMKPNAILINTARGGLVDSAALVAALREGKISGAAIDVLRQEPPVDGDPLLDYQGHNLLLTPHVAWATREARQRAIDELASNVAAFIAGEVRNRVI